MGDVTRLEWLMIAAGVLPVLLALAGLVDVYGAFGMLAEGVVLLCVSQGGRDVRLRRDEAFALRHRLREGGWLLACHRPIMPPDVALDRAMVKLDRMIEGRGA